MKTFVILGASGDLAKRKLIPDLSGCTETEFKIVCYARSDLGPMFRKKLQEFHTYSDDFLDRITYIRGNYETLEGLEPYFNEESFFYLSLPPEISFSLITPLVEKGAKTVVVEKPFGDSPEQLIQIKADNKEKTDLDLLFYDHYLHKPMSFAIRKSLKDKGLADLITNASDCFVIFTESIGGEGRKYFETTGIIKDVVENHLCQILGLIYDGMTEKLNFFKHLKITDLSIGQYETYREEMQTVSQTATLCSLKLKNDLYENTKFKMVAAKGANEKKCEIVFVLPKEEALKYLENKVSFDFDVEKIELIFNYSPLNEIFFSICGIQENKKFVLVDEKSVLQDVSSHYGEKKNYQIVFDCLLKNKSFETVSLDEAIELRYVFDRFKSFNCDLIKYKKGSRIDEIDEIVIY